ncbi:hypothetical protein [Oecophyllibacter saccharovorans]|uniref:hypothetical protein n=1 Tax=Oecophyllibacter saccharovorans TaxID=2558360 RepID=UPI001171834E|nr:hypothetical protein [Oecophyllibacter saccharovorans]TPW34885.1 hypothetical protein E3203_05065 [Oecophyllibacter saccharovorans]
MQELNIFEVEEVSGGFSLGFVDSVAGAINMAADCGEAGAIIGGRFGGSNGGQVGLGPVGNLVGVIYGAAYGAIGGAILGAVDGNSGTAAVQKQIMQGITSGTISPANAGAGGGSSLT